MSVTLHLPQNVRLEILAWAESSYPFEGCGLLVGRAEGVERRVSRATRAHNINTERPHDRYELAPEDFLVAEKAAAEAGLELIGAWHSHPDQAASPSKTDLDLAWPEWSYVIVKVRHGQAVDLRSWRQEDGTFREEALQCWEP